MYSTVYIDYDVHFVLVVVLCFTCIYGSELVNQNNELIHLTLVISGTYSLKLKAAGLDIQDMHIYASTLTTETC